MEQQMRRFRLHRMEDETGVSGTGDVAEGVQFTDGTIALRWLTDTTSTAIYRNTDDLITIHGHGGRTVIRWIDGESAPDAAHFGEHQGLRLAGSD